MLHLHRAERADRLIDGLGELLAQAPEDPFAPELICVPTRGVERWVTQRLSHRLGASAGGDGVCANVLFPFPRRVIDTAVAAATGFDPERDPWRPERAVWPLLEIVDARLHEPWLHTLRAHLGDAGDEAHQARRFGAVRHIADLFDHYAVHRPQLIRGWAGGAGDGWQPQLWRALRERLGTDPATRLAQACEALEADASLTDLPARLSLFGLTRFPPSHLEVLRALATHRDVHLFLLHPSPALWERIEPPATPIARTEDVTRDLPRNRLLRSWGQDARELQLVVAPAGAEHRHELHDDRTTLLARIQQDIRADRPPAGDAAPDDSIRIHACHGRARQVEVLRDQILHLLNDDAEPRLEPRDVIVMCPDIEAFAPLIQATFGAGYDEDAAPGGGLRVRLADRSLRQTNPILGAVAALVDLAEQRMTASQLLDFADREPVRRRFRLDDEQLGELRDWVGRSGIRWGLDAQHRAPFKLGTVGSGTWRFGVDRVLTGVATEQLFAGVLPLDAIASGSIDLAGRFAELVARLGDVVDDFAVWKPIEAWTASLAAAVDALTATRPGETWQREELQRVLDEIADEADGHDVELALPEIRALLAARLQGRPTRANFRTGHLTICTLVPMRSVPHRVVCLLGLDDGCFPRKTPRDGDDLILDDPHVGDRDPRSEDRQMLLDALMAATERLIVTYTGRDERTNLPRPPAVPVGELIDAIQATAPGATVVEHHPLQPFDPRNFEAAAPWSFDAVALEGARAACAPRQTAPPFLAAPLPPAQLDVVELDNLVKFVEHPVRAFLRQRLDVRVGDWDDSVHDALPVELDGLGRWSVGSRMLEGRIGGLTIEQCEAAERARGELPPGLLGDRVLAAIKPTVEEVFAHAEPYLNAGARTVDARAGRLGGSVSGVRGERLVFVTYSRLNAKHRLALWVRWLALQVAVPEVAWEAVAIGRGDDTSARIARLPAGADPQPQLDVLLDLYARGLREPLPLPCAAAAAYARSGVQAARREWESGFRFEREDAELEHRLVFGRVLSFDDLLAFPAREDECWDAQESSRFGQLARRLWGSLLAHEKLENL